MDNKVPDFVKRADKSLNEKKLFIMKEVNKNPDNFISENGLNHTLGYIKDWVQVPENIEKIKDAFTEEDTSDIPRVQEIIGKQLIMAYDYLKNTEAEDGDNFIIRMNKGLADDVGARLFNLMESKWRQKEGSKCCSKEVSFGVDTEGHLTFGNSIDKADLEIPFSKYYEMVNKLYNQNEEMEKPDWGTENHNKEEVKAFITQLSQNGGRKRKRRRKTKRKTKRKSKRKMKRKSKRKTKRRRKRKSKRRR